MNRHNILMAGHLHSKYVRRLPSREFLDDVDPKTGAAGAKRACAEAREGYPDVRRQEVGERWLGRCRAMHRELEQKRRGAAN